MNCTVENSARSRDRLAEQATEILAGAIAIAHAIDEARLRPGRRRRLREPPEPGCHDRSRLFQKEIDDV